MLTSRHTKFFPPFHPLASVAHELRAGSAPLRAGEAKMLLNSITPHGYLQKIDAVGLFFFLVFFFGFQLADFCGQKEERWQ